MKTLILLLVATHFCFAAKAQNYQPQFFQYDAGTLNRRENRAFTAPLIDSNIVRNLTASLVQDKPGVYRLPQDGMPCIVPNMTAVVSIPNAWKGKVKVPYESATPQMPNPGKRPSLQWKPVPLSK